MNRDIDISEISDGKIYDSADMAKLGVDDCSGCHSCCCGMGDSVTLDPYDIYRLEKGLKKSFEELLYKNIELRVVDGIILPCLLMNSEITITHNSNKALGSVTEKEACTFLDENGRCSIHQYRPQICRLFPLGRIYENGSHKYFLQVNECQKERQTKIKIKKWLDTPDFSKYEAYTDKWHFFIKDLSERASSMPQEQLKAVSMGILKVFFMTDYNTDVDFYEQFNDRLARIGL
ncbi:MAG: YkgJ family cysteine cluster protein [Butyrivibrio sp.]|nr:YkgJ family cysteine cluster protein [Butyrivibrio sp.]